MKNEVELQGLHELWKGISLVLSDLSDCLAGLHKHHYKQNNQLNLIRTSNVLPVLTDYQSGADEVSTDKTLLPRAAAVSLLQKLVITP